MKLVTYYDNDIRRPGVLVERSVVDIATLPGLGDAPTRYRSVRSILAAGPQLMLDVAAALDAHPSAAVVGDVATIRLAPPIPDAGKIICVGLNYRAHADEGGREVPDYPSLFAKFSNSLVGPHDLVPLPHIEDPQLDYEGELAVVIGKRASVVAADEALEFVGGISVMNDLTSRRLQYETTQWMLGKAIDNFGPMGPALVTLDEIGDVQNLLLRTRVNGQQVQSANTSTMIWTVAELISIISRTITLEPGDIIATGTPAGVGNRRKPPLFLHDGDVVEVEIERVGSIKNRIGVA